MAEQGDTLGTGRRCVLGLVGGMGSGKSAVAAELVRRGARLVSGDALGHEALKQAGTRDLVVKRWGPEVLDAQGEVDRRKLGAIVFGDPQERKALEDLVFPFIERGLREQIAAAPAELVVLDAAIMMEAGWDRACDKIVFVYAPREMRLRRLAAQRGWSAKEVEARESAQLSLTEKASRADYAIDNSGPPAQLARQVDDLLGRLRSDCKL
jgi:dephospho-CoA kinase